MGSSAHNAGLDGHTSARSAPGGTASQKRRKTTSASESSYKDWRRLTLAQRGVPSGSDLHDGRLKRLGTQGGAIRKSVTSRRAKTTMEALERRLLDGATSVRTPRFQHATEQPHKVVEEEDFEPPSEMEEDHANEEDQSETRTTPEGEIYNELEDTEMEEGSEEEAPVGSGLSAVNAGVKEQGSTAHSRHKAEEARAHSGVSEGPSSGGQGGDKHVRFTEPKVSDRLAEEGSARHHQGPQDGEHRVEELPALEVIDLNEIYDYSVDYRGHLEPPEGPVQKLEFPKLPPAKTQVQKQEEVVEEWERLVERRKKLHPYDENLVRHTIDRLEAHRAALEDLIAEEPFLPQYKDQRIEILKGCLDRYVNADEIVNVKAAIKAYEDGVLTNSMDQWTVFYNGKIVDRINSHREVLWSVRKPLYEEVHGKQGAIWIEPPSNDEGTACVALNNETMCAGSGWYVEQTLCLPWYQTNYAKEFRFLLDTGATDAMVKEEDLLDLGLIKQNCPHISSRTLVTALGPHTHDFYPIFIQHQEPPDVTDQFGDRIQLYPFMDSLTAVLVGGSCDRLSGLDLFRYCYVATEPSTGRLDYTTALDQMAIRPGIMPGGTMTPRAWYTRQWDHRTGTFVVSQTVCSLTGRFPRLLNPEGARWVINEPFYPYQYGRDDRSPYELITYIPGHKVHPPTPDDIRADRKYYWSQGWAYRDNRPFVWSSRVTMPEGTAWERDLYYGGHQPGFTPPHKRPLNPWQYKLPEEAWAAPDAQNLIFQYPMNPEGVMYWDENFPAVITQQGLSPLIVPSFQPGQPRQAGTFPKDDDYSSMRFAMLGAERLLSIKNAAGAYAKPDNIKQPRYLY